MIEECYPIPGGDLQQAGTASRSLKERLKRIGVEPGILRRVMIVAYEAEMNVVIHACRGRMHVRLEAERVDLEITDQGPGIADIEQAMRAGFSTAPPEAREMGFGAGLGLPNIRRSSDRFEIFSEVGSGTRVCATVFLKPQEAAAPGGGSVEARDGLCRSCLACLRACPTQALRVRRGRPAVRSHRCVDCGACLAACPNGALGIRDLPREAAAGTADLVLPAAFLAGFGRLGGPPEVLAALARLGYSRVRCLEEWERALERAVATRVAGEGQSRPVISPRCPAVVNLIGLRFPGLIGHLAPFLSPVEAAARAYGLREAAFVVGCPAQRAALEAGGLGSRLRPVHPRWLAEAVLPLLNGAEAGSAGAGGMEAEGAQARGMEAGAVPADGGPADGGTSAEVLRAGGPAAVRRLLEKAEDGELADVGVLELTFCEGGCSGAPLLGEEAALALYRWRRSARAGSVPAAAPAASSPSPEVADPGRAADPAPAAANPGTKGNPGTAGIGPAAPPAPAAAAVKRRQPVTARPGLRLDEDMAAAVRKLGRIDRLARSLPGRDCGMCGAPSCAALAEDVVLGRAEEGDCPFWKEGSGGVE